MSEIVLTLNAIEPLELFGVGQSKLKILKEAFPQVNISTRGAKIKLEGEKKHTQNLKSKLELMIKIIKEGNELTKDEVKSIVDSQYQYEDDKTTNGHKNENVIVYGRSGKSIKAKTRSQKKMIEASSSNDIVFAIGPAGTGKTYTAVALAVSALKTKLVKKIVLTRPAVEAGESLGFLPGDLKEKIDPYLIPLYDALNDMIPVTKLEHFISNRTIEIAPLAFMRGRTLDNAFIILDEAQNATYLQLKMFLTRLGPTAKCIITGDLSQIDLPRKNLSGLNQTIHILRDIEGIFTIRLSSEDVIRHRLVKQIVKAYENEDNQNDK